MEYKLGYNVRKHIFCKYKGEENNCPNECTKCPIKIRETGDSLLRKGLTNEAIAQYKRALFTEPQYPQAWMKLGEAYASQSMHEEAIKAFEKALMIDPLYGDAMLNKAVVLKQIGNYTSAFETANAILKFYSSNMVCDFRKELAALGNIEIVNTEQNSLLLSRLKIDERLDKLMQSYDDYNYCSEDDDIIYTIPSAQYVELDFVCDKCGNRVIINVMDVDGKGKEIIKQYTKTADEYFELGCFATFSCYCDKCADELYPLSQHSKHNNFVFSTRLAGDKNNTCSFPSTKFFDKLPYMITKAFLCGAQTFDEISAATDTFSNQEVYLEYLKDVIGADFNNIYYDFLKNYTSNQCFLNRFADYFTKDCLAEAQKRIDDNREQELKRLEQTTFLKVSYNEIAEMLIVLTRYLKIRNLRCANTLVQNIARFTTSKKQQELIINMLVNLDADITILYLQERLALAISNVKRKNASWIERHYSKYNLLNDDIEYIRRRSLQISYGDTSKEFRNKLITEILSYIKEHFPPVFDKLKRL